MTAPRLNPPVFGFPPTPPYMQNFQNIQNSRMPLGYSRYGPMQMVRQENGDLSSATIQAPPKNQVPQTARNEVAKEARVQRKAIQKDVIKNFNKLLLLFISLNVFTC